ncbi:MAG: IS701 family transposase [Cytophagales bacterium]
MAFLTSFRKPFEDSKKSLFSKAQWVVQGILSAPRKNLQVIAQSLGKSDHQALNHFLSDSNWDWAAVSDQVAVRFYKLVERLNAVANLCLIIDESGIPKKGDQSAGVTRQYCGATGKIDNCQVGVFAALSCGALVNIIKAVLYLPQSWINDKKRLDKVAVPQEHRTYKSKIDIALGLIVDIKKRLQIPFQWVVFDAFYGRDLGLLRELHRLSITFMAQIPESHHVFLTDFELKIPRSKSKRGRPFTKLKPTRTSLSVTRYVKRLKTCDWKKLTVRTSSTGVLKAYFHRVPVWLFDDQAVKKCRFTLLIRKDVNGDISFHLTNSTAHLQRLAYMQAQRYFVERAFRDAKQELGMDQYQVRGYAAWHKHMALVMMAQLFIQQEKVRIDQKQVTISTQDIVKIIIALLLPQKNLDELIQQINVKNKTLFAKIRYLTK